MEITTLQSEICLRSGQEPSKQKDFTQDKQITILPFLCCISSTLGMAIQNTFKLHHKLWYIRMAKGALISKQRPGFLKKLNYLHDSPWYPRLGSKSLRCSGKVSSLSSDVFARLFTLPTASVIKCDTTCSWSMIRWICQMRVLHYTRVWHADIIRGIFEIES